VSEPTPRRIWLVDDSATNRAMTQHALGESYAFEQFKDGSELVERVGAGAALPDLVLLDWVMPGMTGGEVCRFLRAHPTTQELPIIIVTASRIEIEDVVQGLAVGANDYVARPFAPEELRARVKTVLRSKQLSDASLRERMRLAAINRLGRALFADGHDVQRVLDELAIALTTSICDGCAITLLPGDLPAAHASRHHADATAAALSAIGTLADPVIHHFETTELALATLPPAYHAYVQRFGLRSLAILPFPVREPIQGIVTVTRDAGKEPLDLDDIATIETCIDYASLAVQTVLKFEAERLARGRISAILAHAPIGIVVTDAAAEVVLANPLAQELAGADAGALASSLGVGSSPGGTVRAERVVGTRTLSLVAGPLRTNDVPSGTITTIEDVSEARAFAAERERVAQYQEQMLGIVGHDLRNPLSAILAGTEAIGIHAESIPAVKPLVTRISGSVRRMARIVDQLHDVTRARLGGGIPLALVDTELGGVAQSVLDELQLATPTAKIELRTRGDLTGVWDADRLGQVLSNLTANALQYGRPGGAVQVELAGEEDRVTITVTNELRDAPIPFDRLASMFEPYRRGQEGAHRPGGLGLGLYIVHELVRAHHGTITATSTRETGTVLMVNLPRSSRR
jgi:sigma-B regulation protein RsbU (phosphoserine phosphatase)